MNARATWDSVAPMDARLGRTIFSLLPLGGLLASCAGSPADSNSARLGFDGTGGDCGGDLRGIDVSTFNGTVDWAAVADGGISFAFAKASEGLTIRDDQFPANWAGMKGSGVARGAYHFFRAGDDDTAQADAFLSWVGTLANGDLPPVLDWETSDESDVASTVAAARAFVAEIQARTGRATIIYTDRAYWDSLGDPADFAANPLWFASDEISCPTPPAPWSDWLFWQYSTQGMVVGVSGAVDLDWFAGSLGDLLSFAGVDAGAPTAADAGAFTDAGDGQAAGEPMQMAEPSGCEQRTGSTATSPLGPLAVLLGRLRLKKLGKRRDARGPLAPP